MFAKTLMLAALAVLTMGAAAKPKAPPAKPAPAASAKATPAKPPPPKPGPTAPIANFDAQDPMSVIALMNTSGGKASLVGKQEDTVQVSVTSVAANFGIIFAGCDAQGRRCKALQFDYADDKAGPSFAQVNAFNQTSALCRSYEDKGGHAHVLFSMLLFEGDLYGRFRDHVAAWTGCIGDFRTFLKDPNAYLAAAP